MQSMTKMAGSARRRLGLLSTMLPEWGVLAATLAVATCLAPLCAHAQAHGLARPAGDGGRGIRCRRQHRRDGAHGEQVADGEPQAELRRENRIGAGGALAAAHVAQAAPDGYTLFFAASPQLAIVPQLQKVNYDPKKDFVPVGVFGTGPFILGISASIPAKTLAEFVAYAKTRKINYGSSGVGSIAHLSAALFVARAGLDAVHIPFRGSGQVTAALLGGQIDMFFGNASDSSRRPRAARWRSWVLPPRSG